MLSSSSAPRQCLLNGSLLNGVNEKQDTAGLLQILFNEPPEGSWSRSLRYRGSEWLVRARRLREAPSEWGQGGKCVNEDKMQSQLLKALCKLVFSSQEKIGKSSRSQRVWSTHCRTTHVHPDPNQTSSRHSSNSAFFPKSPYKSNLDTSWEVTSEMRKER